MDNVPTIRLMLFGNWFVGKSSLQLRFIFDKFEEETDLTWQDPYNKTILIDNETIALDILDTYSSEIIQNDSYNIRYLKKSDGFVLVYSLDNYFTFCSLESYIEVINKYKQMDLNVKIPCALCGNKRDLNTQLVSQREVIKFAKKWNMSLIETSAKQNFCVNECFFHIAKVIKNQKDFATKNMKSWNTIMKEIYDSRKSCLVTKNNHNKTCFIV
ncbi:hypothetical protein EIN_358530 [Entamoeba invadens IP1]|uniref:Uncharacterized protein n=1 Tax=Entamoeba invadens IP1 TaxID=370355 RepID=A0A0A1U1M9_ENTIV|nr:hypothetical protein EIN_358530 [Entamoeba invadens IP1]ELP84933.1 hypothetical protein EIN_358530 [Entamoeba invadens IP1]|eukprot:XP_004184279.1 hypothetical protein EIN_358530 [Entamoeba invadens IP1]